GKVQADGRTQPGQERRGSLGAWYADGRGKVADTEANAQATERNREVIEENALSIERLNGTSAATLASPRLGVNSSEGRLRVSVQEESEERMPGPEDKPEASKRRFAWWTRLLRRTAVAGLGVLGLSASVSALETHTPTAEPTFESRSKRGKLGKLVLRLGGEGLKRSPSHGSHRSHSSHSSHASHYSGSGGYPSPAPRQPTPRSDPAPFYTPKPAPEPKP